MKIVVSMFFLLFLSWRVEAAFITASADALVYDLSIPPQDSYPVQGLFTMTVDDASMRITAMSLTSDTVSYDWLGLSPALVVQAPHVFLDSYSTFLGTTEQGDTVNFFEGYATDDTDGLGVFFGIYKMAFLVHTRSQVTQNIFVEAYFKNSAVVPEGESWVYLVTALIGLLILRCQYALKYIRFFGTWYSQSPQKRILS